jgi:SAM-dependent methyltransferase
VRDQVIDPILGSPTDHEFNIRYRVGRVAPYLSGRWLDMGCANGGYDAALLEAGASEIVGVDVEPSRLEIAQARGLERADYRLLDGETLPFEDDAFDGVWMNEILEHVRDESLVLSEVNRVLRRGGVLALISPNRWFPFEGHGMEFRGFRVPRPVPLLPWLPRSIGDRVMQARNYWPRELVQRVEDAGLSIVEVSYIWPVFEAYPWLPGNFVRWYQKHVDAFDHMPVFRRFGVSTMVIGRRT